MNKRFLKTYFYVLLGLCTLFLILAYYCDIHQVYVQLIYQDKFPAVVAFSSFALLSSLSLLIAVIFVRKPGHTPLRFSWINLVLFILVTAFSLFMVWQAPRGSNMWDYMKDYYSDMITMAVVCILAVTLTSAISYLIRQTGNRPAEETKSSGSWYSVFMFLTLIMALIYLLIGIFVFEKGYTQRDSFFVLLVIIVVNLLSAVVVALLSVGGSILMEKNKPMGFIVQAFTVIIFLSSHVSYLTVMLLATESMDLGYYTDKDNPWETANSFGHLNVEEIPREYYTSESEGESEMDDEDESDFYINEDLSEILTSEAYNPMWYNSPSPQDSIYGMLRGTKKELTDSYLLLHINLSYIKGLFPHYYNDSKDESLFYRFLLYVSDYRDILPLGSMAEVYRPLIRQIIPDEVYYENSYDHILYWLNYAYADIVNSANGEAEYSQLYEQIYEIMSEDLSSDSERYEKYFHKIAAITHLEDASLEKFESLYYGDKTINKEAVVWAYSFWARRWKEGNIDKARGVIAIIERMYPGEGEE